MHAPLTIRAKSGDAAFLRLLGRAQFRGTVHSVFDKAVNLQCETSDKMYTLAATSMDDAPNTLVVATPGFARSGISRGDRAVGELGTLSIADKLTISFADAAEWQMAAPARYCRGEDLRPILAWVRDQVVRRGTGGGTIADPHGSSVSRITTEMLQRAGNGLVGALVRQDLPEAVTQAGRMIGLGPGLTPSGDDFLVGLVAAIRTARPIPVAFEDFCSVLVPMSKTATNAISHAAVAAAARGEVRQSVARLLACLHGGDRQEICPALDDVLAIGSSSGTDIAWGVVYGLDVMLTIGEHAHGTAIRH